MSRRPEQGPAQSGRPACPSCRARWRAPESVTSTESPTLPPLGRPLALCMSATPGTRSVRLGQRGARRLGCRARPGARDAAWPCTVPRKEGGGGGGQERSLLFRAPVGCPMAPSSPNPAQGASVTRTQGPSHASPQDETRKPRGGSLNDSEWQRVDAHGSACAPRGSALLGLPPHQCPSPSPTTGSRRSLAGLRRQCGVGAPQRPGQGGERGAPPPGQAS